MPIFRVPKLTPKTAAFFEAHSGTHERNLTSEWEILHINSGRISSKIANGNDGPFEDVLFRDKEISFAMLVTTS